MKPTNVEAETQTEALQHHGNAVSGLIQEDEELPSPLLAEVGLHFNDHFDQKLPSYCKEPERADRIHFGHPSSFKVGILT